MFLPKTPSLHLFLNTLGGGNKWWGVSATLCVYLFMYFFIDLFHRYLAIPRNALTTHEVGILVLIVTLGGIFFPPHFTFQKHLIKRFCSFFNDFYV